MSQDRLNQVLEQPSFEYLLDLEVHKAVRYLYFFSLLVVQFNGQNGHGNKKEEAGPHDAIAGTMSHLIRDVIRGTDVVGRIGGGKFFVILHQSDHQQARSIGGRIMQRIQNYTFTIGDEEIRKTISVGGACFPTHANDMDSLMGRAEEMLGKSLSEGSIDVSLPS
jgi:diguanylate cyclase (GGDEF)-like protein